MHVQIVKLYNISIRGKEPRSAFPCMGLVGTVVTISRNGIYCSGPFVLGNRLIRIAPACREKRLHVLVSNGHGRRHGRTGYLGGTDLIYLWWDT